MDDLDAATLRLAGRRLRPAAPGLAAPTVLMIHGFRYDPEAACADPHATLFRDGPTPPTLDGRGRARSWPHGLGFTGGGADHALCLGFGWRAREGMATGYLRGGANGFAIACRAARDAGETLADALWRLAPALQGPVDVMAHSLGARVALEALRRTADRARGTAAPVRFGRMILMGPAAFAAEARAALAACDAARMPTPEVYCLSARGNARFDLLFEMLGPWGMGPSLGRAGLGERRARWLDLAFDHPALERWAADRGVAMAPARRGPCHWSFYTRPGAMALHRAILTRAPGFGVEEMRASGAPERLPASRRRGAPAAATPEPTAA
ncbi:MAG: alpha/beta hydrolase [Rubrimonas sp.]